ncbi:MAG: helix-turn-helix transcriptional regulator [Chloroflexi bacterium]|nr:helix-turn-helix transcriptional regulator [Chloroflexota bacterium]MYC02761.1 helix-turn-helix transcriptional regulator [Chloroflexota bacterium]
MARARLSQIGTLVKERRGAQGVRQAAKEIGVSSATLSRVENGKQPDLLTFEKLCRWLQMSPSEFLDVGDSTSSDGTAATPAVATAHLRAKRDITPELANALGEMIIRAQAMLADEPDPEDDE